MPFITEELWQKTGETGPARETLLIEASWPRFKGLGDAKADAELAVGDPHDLGGAFGARRDECPGSGEAFLFHRRGPCRKPPHRVRLGERNHPARPSREDHLLRPVPPGAAQLVLGEAIVALPLSGVIDLVAERARLEREQEKIDADVGQIAARLSNSGFVAKAPEQVLEETRERKTALEARRDRKSPRRCAAWPASGAQPDNSARFGAVLRQIDGRICENRWPMYCHQLPAL